MSRKPVKTFSSATDIGDECYTWEQVDGHWDDYKFETENPESIYSTYDFDEPLSVIRKRWMLVDVTELTLFIPDPDPEDDEAVSG